MKLRVHHWFSCIRSGNRKSFSDPQARRHAVRLELEPAFAKARVASIMTVLGSASLAASPP